MLRHARGYALASAGHDTRALQYWLGHRSMGCYSGHRSEVDAINDWSAEETDNPLLADDRNFYKVEKWTKDDQRIERMLWPTTRFDKGREILNAEVNGLH
jgi:hypothetical protein